MAALSKPLPPGGRPAGVKRAGSIMAAIMHWLALDTSTDVLSMAVGHGDQVWAHTSAGGAQASLDGLPTVQRLMAEAGLRWQDLTAIVMGRGPGAFTGLRTACAMAQGLAWGADLPVLPIDTLLAVAEQARHAHPGAPEGERVLAVNDARMGQVYVAAYVHTAQGWQCERPSAVCAPEALDVPASWHAQPYAVAGNAQPVHAPVWPHRLTGPCWLASPSAEALIRLAPQAWSDGLAVPAEQALPLYVRDKVADTTAEREQRKALA